MPVDGLIRWRRSRKIGQNCTTHLTEPGANLMAIEAHPTSNNPQFLQRGAQASTDTKNLRLRPLYLEGSRSQHANLIHCVLRNLR
jgi:hypothetical protein